MADPISSYDPKKISITSKDPVAIAVERLASWGRTAESVQLERSRDWLGRSVYRIRIESGSPRSLEIVDVGVRSGRFLRHRIVLKQSGLPAITEEEALHLAVEHCRRSVLGLGEPIAIRLIRRWRRESEWSIVSNANLVGGNTCVRIGVESGFVLAVGRRPR